MIDATSIITAVLSAAVSLIVAFGTWHVSMKKDREAQVEEVKKTLEKHREEYLTEIRSVQDDISQVNATVQSQIGIIEYEIKTLSDRVDKHNNVIERTYKLEQGGALRDERISNIEHRVDRLEA